jgi:selenide,water dikinase
MLPGTLGKQFRDDDMRIDLRSLAERAGAHLVMATVSGLDLQAGRILFSDHDPIPFDVLSIGVGSMPAGWQQHASSPSVVPIKPMQTFLQRLDTCLHSVESASNRTIRVAIAGGGVAAVEIAFCLQERFREQNIGREIAIEIFTSSQQVADGMTQASVRRIERLLLQRGINVHTNSRITDVGQQAITSEDGMSYPADCVIWATGAAAPLVLSRLGLKTDSRGFIATSRTLQSLSDPRVFAVGDSGTVIESPSPKAGVYAVRQCPILWHNLQALLNKQPLQKFEPQNDFLKILNTGDGKALLEYGWLTVHARWCLVLKTWIDRRFIRMFQTQSIQQHEGDDVQNKLTSKTWSGPMPDQLDLATTCDASRKIVS